MLPSALSGTHPDQIPLDPSVDFPPKYPMSPSPLRPLARALSAVFLTLLSPTIASAGTPVVHIAGEERPDPHRWLEHTRAPEVQAWWAERDAETRAWIAEAGREEAFAEWHRAWSASNSPGLTLADARGDVTVARVGTEGRDTLRVTTPQGQVALTADLDESHAVCWVSLDRAAQRVVWARRVAPTGGACRLYVADVADGKGTPVFEGEHVSARFSPDGQRLLVTHYADKAWRVVEIGRAGEVHGERLSYPRELKVEWLPDGRVVALANISTGYEAASRLAFGPVDDIQWLGNSLIWPPWAEYQFAGVDGDHLLFVTNADAPAKKLIRLDPAHPFKADWEVVKPEPTDSKIVTARRLGNHLLLVRQVEGVFTLEASALVPSPGETPVQLGTATDEIRIGGDADEAVVVFGTLGAYRLVTIDPELTVRERHADPTKLAFSTEYATSEDGTRVPISVVRPIGVSDDAPVWLEVYGGYGVGLTVLYREQAHLWTSLGGIYAIAHVRGGDERGAAWHQAVRDGHVARTIDDVVAVAQSFQPRQVVLTGESFGGFVAGTAAAWRPDLFAAVLPRMGVFDLVRAGVFQPWRNLSDFGGRRNGPLPEQRARLSLSAVYATPPGPLPPMLIVTGRQDRRVPPQHSFKLAAAWRELPGGPVLLRVDPWVTHAGPQDDRTWASFDEDWGSSMAFVVRALGLDWVAPSGAGEERVAP